VAVVEEFLAWLTHIERSPNAAAPRHAAAKTELALDTLALRA